MKKFPWVVVALSLIGGAGYYGWQQLAEANADCRRVYDNIYFLENEQWEAARKKWIESIPEAEHVRFRKELAQIDERQEKVNKKREELEQEIDKLSSRVRYRRCWW